MKKTMNSARSQLELSRRQFLAGAAAATVAGASLFNMPQVAAEDKMPGFKKAVKWYMVQVPGSVLDKFKLLKELGFDGIELDSPGPITVEEVLKAKDETGLEVPGVVDSVHWNKRLSDPNPEVRAEGLEALKTAMKFSKDIGGTSVLLVPGRVTADATYEQAFERSVAEVKKVTGLADEMGMDILIENVWNDFLIAPQQMADFIDACESPRVGSYFDVGNTVRYSPPAEWVPILGKRIKKLDIKDYKKVAEGESLGKGFGAKLLEGDADFPAVMAELKKVGFTSGWGTAEIPGGNREWLTDVAARMDKIFAS